ncbi:hypothetical protein GCM10020331_056780 [Ectobacillus funiculus]
METILKKIKVKVVKKMIYTCTLNPSIDYIVHVNNFQLGDLNRISFEDKYPGGKGINVSRVLKRAGVESEALGFVGGFTGTYVEDFSENRRDCDKFHPCK